MTAYIISYSSPVHDDWFSDVSGDSWVNNWCRARYSQEQKTIRGWNNVTVTMTGYSNTDWAKNKWDVAVYLRLSPGVPWIGNTGYTNLYGHDLLDDSGKIFQKFIGWFGSISRNNFVTQKTVSLANAATTTAYGCCVSSVCRSGPEWTPEDSWTFTYTFSK